jgi:hypothetical protein
MEQMIASWSMVMVHALMVAGLSQVPIKTRSSGRDSDEPPRAFGTVNEMGDRSGGSDGPS